MFLVLVLTTLVVAIAVAGVLDRRRSSRRAPYRILVGTLRFGATLALLWLSLVGALLVALFEPWPLSRRQGPDTEYARSCFLQHLGQSPPEGITNIYCREEWGFGGDSIYTMRFSFRDESALVELVRRLGLESVPATNRDRVRYLSGPSWWPTRAQLEASLEAYHRSRVEFLWIDRNIDRNLGVAYYQRANF